MSADLTTIYASHWRDMFARHRAGLEPNSVMEFITQTLQRGNGASAGLRGRPGAQHARCSAASLSPEGNPGAQSIGDLSFDPTREIQFESGIAPDRTPTGRFGQPRRARAQPLADNPLSLLSPEPKEGSCHALNDTPRPAPSDYGVGSHDLTFAANNGGCVV